VGCVCQDGHGAVDFTSLGITLEDGSVPKSICYISGMSGRFDGGGERVGTLQGWTGATISPSNTTVDARICADDGLVQGRIHCVHIGESHFWNITSDVKIHSNHSPIELVDANTNICFLTGISGEFRGGGEFVEIFRRQLAGQPEMWVLRAQHKSGEGVAAEAACFPFEQPSSK
jgi:hypothetical protein